MKYLPTIDLWNPAFAAAVYSGQLRLQSGQWIQCGTGPRSRFIELTRGGTIHAKHFEGPSRTATHKYLEWIRGQRQAARDFLADKRAARLIRDRAPLFLELATGA